MKEELTSKFVEILTSVQNAVGKAGDFAMEQLPDIAQSYVIYGRINNTLSLIILLVVCIFSIWSVLKISRNPKLDQWDDWSIPTILSLIFFGFSGVVTFFYIFVCMSSTILVWVSPKVWLLKELTELIK